MTPDPPPRPTPTRLGPVEVGPVAHGGHCVARHDNRVIFVRHALPGERVMLEVTDDSHDRFWRADAVEVLEPSPDRVTPRCAVAGPGLCGGCDFQHVELTAQRALKTAVVAEQLLRLAGLEWAGEVEEVSTADTADGLHWRTRMRYQVDTDGRAGLRAHRSHLVVPVPEDGCPLADRRTPAVAGDSWEPGSELVTVTGSGPHQGVLLVDGVLRQGTRDLVEETAGRSYRVAADGFWQVHPAAATTLVAAVLDALAPRAGERAFDLYCGVGLFAGALADAGCQVWGVESARPAVVTARRNLSDHADRTRFSADRVDRALSSLPARTDLVVLDPPRTGAGKDVIRALVSRRPRAVAYVACDPAALARDLATAAAVGYVLAGLRAFDLFPMTHHVECVALLVPDPGSGGTPGG